MTHALITTTLWMDSGLPEDYVVNTWHIDTVSSDPLAGATDFFNDVTVFYQAIDGYFSADLEGTLAVKAYDMSDPEPRVPILINGNALTPGTGRLPSEVSVCLSFQGVRVSGQPQARRRGRVYIGPFATAVCDAGTGRPSSTFVTDLVDAADDLLTASSSSSTYTWSVYSPTAGTLVGVADGWVDNAFDTQRRRGVRPTTRVTFT